MTPPKNSSVPTRKMVVDYLEKNPDKASKREIARRLRIPAEHKQALRDILAQLESEGALVRTAKRAFQPAETPPATGVVQFERLDNDGELIGRASGRDGPFGPDIFYRGAKGKGREIALAPGDRALCSIEKDREGVYWARAIKKFDVPTETSIIGVYRANKHGGIVEPTSRKEKHDYVVEKADSRDARDGDLVRINPKRGGKAYGPKKAVVVEVVGHVDDPRASSLIAMHTHGVPDEFTDALIEEAKKAKPAKAQRDDLTKIPLITIDPEDARDHDDAVFAEPQGKGWRVIVAIADVAAYVQVGTALDKEAYRRGNSTYFPDRVSPMLPEALSADQCSLRENELRETFAVEMIFGSDGRKSSHRFIRGMMRSAAKLSYQEAQDAIDGKPSAKAQPLLETVLRPLWAAYGAVLKARKDRAPLELDLPERRVRIGEDGKIASITVRERFDAHKLIEEFMIQANVCAAETLEAKKVPPIYRVHEEPSDEKIAQLGTILESVGLKWTKGEKATGRRFNRLLDDAKGSENEHVIHEIVLRSQSQARYSPESLGHFGLNLQRYAHFTSPIRRYADLIVHRQLIRALDLGPDGLSDEEMVRLEEIAEHITMTERRSMAAEREATDRYLAHFMSEHVGATFAGRIAGVNRAGLFVRLNDTGADGFIPAARISDEYWVHDEAYGALVGTQTGQRYEMGMPVEVKLLEVTPIQGGLLFSIETDPRPRRNDLKAPRSDRGRGAGRGGGKGGRPNKRGGAPPGVRLSKKKSGDAKKKGATKGSAKGPASYGKNKKKKKR